MERPAYQPTLRPDAGERGAIDEVKVLDRDPHAARAKFTIEITAGSGSVCGLEPPLSSVRVLRCGNGSW